MNLKNSFPHLGSFDSVLILSTADWDNPFWTNKQHMAVRLAEAGFKVLYVESVGLRKVAVSKGDSLRLFRRLLKGLRGARKVRNNLYVFSPLVVPKHDNLFIKKLNDFILLFSLWGLMASLDFKKTFGWTYNPLSFSLLSKLDFVFNVYHSVDDLSAAPRLPKEEIETQEGVLLKFVDQVFVTSLALKQKYLGQGIESVRYYPNVADFEHFHKATLDVVSIAGELNAFSCPRIGFVGAISSYKVDFKLIRECALAKPDWHWILIGKVGEGDPETDISILSLPNIHLLGPRSYQELPSYLKGFDVTVLPCVLNKYTEAMFPMKFFEYLAAGKMIVSTPLPSLAENKGLFLEAATSAEFITKIESVLAGHDRFSEAMLLAAKENTWEVRMNKMFQDIENRLITQTGQGL